jgi:serine/threonine-protein kinase
VTSKAHLAGDLVGGRYEIRGFVGKRPLGIMYRAFDREVEVEVALRVLPADLLPDEAARQAFAQKISRARGLQHPNLMRFHSVAIDADEVAVAVQWAPGTPLVNRIPKEGMSPSQARPILAQVAAGMQHAHSQGLVLGDVRPQTVIVYADGLKLSNIGIGLALPRRAFLEALQATPAHAYLAPELRAGRVAEPRADVFSLAALTVELLTGRPVQAGSRMSLQTLALLPTSLGAALSRALADDPMVRHATIEALAREIDVILSTGAPPRQRKTLPPIANSAEPTTDPEGKPRGFQQNEEQTRQVSHDELLQIKGHEITRRVSYDELQPLVLQSSGNEEPLELEAEFESERTLDGEHGESDTEQVHKLEPEDAKFDYTDPVVKVDPEEKEEEDDDSETVRVEKLDPEEHAASGVVSSAPPPGVIEPVVPKIQTELPIERNTPPKGAPVAALPPPVPPRSTAPPPLPPLPPPPVLTLSPVPALPEVSPLPPPPAAPLRARAPTPAGGVPRAPTPASGVPRAPTPGRGVPRVGTPSRGTPLPPMEAAPVARRSRKGLVVGVVVIVSFASVLVALIVGIADHMREVRLTQERAEKQRLVDELNARAEAMRRASTPEQPPSSAHPQPPPSSARPQPPPAAPPAQALVPVAEPFSVRCPLGAHLVEGGPHRYCVDIYEYPGGKTIPRTEVSYAEAARLCASRGERLCSAEEWERACRGKSGASYPYGQSFDPTRCNTRGSGGEIAPAGSFTSCRSASGAYDMSGNVAEWVTTSHGAAQKGGSVLSTNPLTRCSNVVRSVAEEGGIYVGFRCCSDLR